MRRDAQRTCVRDLRIKYRCGKCCRRRPESVDACEPELFDPAACGRGGGLVGPLSSSLELMDSAERLGSKECEPLEGVPRSDAEADDAES
jgi:hypothetical protein